jgi:hypothetical protein
MGTGGNAMQEDAMGQLRALHAKFSHNYVMNDVVSHAAITHEKFVCVNSKGARESRKEYLSRWATGFDPEVIVYWDYRDEQISIFDKVALVRGTNKHTLRRNGTDTTGMNTYTDTYIFENGEWKCIQAQITPVSSEHYPGDETIVRKYIKGRLQSK